MIAARNDGHSDDDRALDSPSVPSNRPRAPTINIDDSAVSASEKASESYQLQEISPPGGAQQAAQHAHNMDGSSSPLPRQPPPISTEHPPSNPTSSPANTAELRPSPSFESRDGKSTSPHNVSSPTATKSNGQGKTFLSVPDTRSRGNSVDSQDVTLSPTSLGGDTVISSPSSSHNDETRRTETAHSTEPLVPDDEALKPDPGTELDFNVTDNRFAFSPGQLNKLLNPKSLGAFHALGGLSGLERGLRTDRRAGLSVDEEHLSGTVSFEDAVSLGKRNEDPVKEEIEAGVNRRSTLVAASSPDSFADRKRIFADNRLPEIKSKSIWELAWLAYNDKVLILLTVAAIVSLSLGIYQAVRPNEPEKTAWVEGVAIIVAIVIVVVVGAGNDWQKERQFVKLNKKKDDRVVKVIRSGKSREISVFDVLVGDVIHLEPGDLIPVDGIFISGHNVTCDESSATGESDLLKKTSADSVYRAIENHESLKKLDCFIVSGSKVSEGYGTFLSTSVGVNSTYGRTMLSLHEDPQTTPLQSKLNKLAEYIAKLGLTAALVLFGITFIEFIVRFARRELPNMDPNVVAQDFLQIFITAVTVVVVAVPEGLPLAVTLALAFATTRMLKDNNLVRQLRACETMGNATTICSDKTGTLTQNKMTVVAGTIGESSKFGESSVPRQDGEPGTEQTEVVPGPMPSQVMGTLAEHVRETLKQSIAINTTAFEGEIDGKETYIGSKTETAMLHFARDFLGMDSLAEERASAKVVQMVPFDSKRKCMATAVKLAHGKYRLYVKGASEILLAQCENMVTDPTRGLQVSPIQQSNLSSLNQAIKSYASRSLRTIGIVYRDFEQWPPKGTPVDRDDPNNADFDVLFRNMTFFGIVGIQDPLRVGVADAVKACQRAGVTVRMVTGDNVITARAIARDCGIYTDGGIVLEGPEFRKMGKVMMSQTLPKLQVLARSSPEDKRLLVKRLRELGETVAVTGDGTNDAPALKTADIGFSMGIAGTEVAKEASAIILMDDNFASIVKAMMWGRAVNDSVKKFLQFQLTVNITAVLLAFISAVSSQDQRSVITAVQLLWVNLIMDTLAALALATDPPSSSVLDRKPEPKSAPLISVTMWKMIIGQSIYQMAVTLVLYFAGEKILPTMTPDEKATLIFNAFVWMQIFNQYNCRRLDNKLNILEGAFRNYFFIGIQVIVIAAQVIIIFYGGQAFSVVSGINSFTGEMWAISLVVGAISVVIAIIIRCIPDSWIENLLPFYFKRKVMPQVLVSDEERQYQWNPALDEIKEELAFLKMLRGGRLTMLKYKLRHPQDFFPRSRSVSRSRTNSNPRTPVNEPNNTAASEGGTPAPPTPESRRSFQRRRGRSRSNSAFGPAAAMAGIVAGSIVGGWNLPERRDGDQSSTDGAHQPDASQTATEGATEGHSQESRSTFGPLLVPPSQDETGHGQTQS